MFRSAGGAGYAVKRRTACRSAAVCAVLQTMADYAALQEPFYLSKLIPAEYLPSRINC